MSGTFTFAPSKEYVLKIYCKLGNQVSVNTRTFKTTEESDAIFSDLAAEQLAEFCLQAYQPLLSAAATFRGITVAVYHENRYCMQPSNGRHYSAHGALHMPEVGEGGFGAAYIPGMNKARRTYYIAAAVHRTWPHGAEFRKRWREYRRLLLDQAVDDPPEFIVSSMPALPNPRYASGFEPGRETERWTFQFHNDREFLCDVATEAEARRRAWAMQNERDARGEL